MKRSILVIIFCILFPIQAESWNSALEQITMKRVIQVSLALIGSGVGYAGYQLAHNPDTEVTKERLQLTVLHKEKINTSEYVVLFAHGIDMKTGAHVSQADAYAHIIQAPTVTFAFQDTVSRLNFAQETDMQCLRMAYNYVRTTYPNKKIIVAGLSRGASSIVKLLHEQHVDIAAVILESPWDTIKHLTNHIADTYLFYLPGSRTLLHKLVCSLPNMDDCQADVINHAKQLHTDIPMFVAYTTCDKVVPPAGSETVFQTLIGAREDVTKLVLENGKHGKLAEVPEFQKHLSQFIASL